MEENNLEELKLQLRKLLVGIKPKFWNESIFRIKHSELFKKFENYHIKIKFKKVFIHGDGEANFDTIEVFFEEI